MTSILKDLQWNISHHLHTELIIRQTTPFSNSSSVPGFCLSFERQKSFQYLIDVRARRSWPYLEYGLGNLRQNHEFALLKVLRQSLFPITYLRYAGFHIEYPVLHEICLRQLFGDKVTAYDLFEQGGKIRKVEVLVTNPRDGIVQLPFKEHA